MLKTHTISTIITGLFVFVVVVTHTLRLNRPNMHPAACVLCTLLKANTMFSYWNTRLFPIVILSNCFACVFRIFCVLLSLGRRTFLSIDLGTWFENNELMFRIRMNMYSNRHRSCCCGFLTKYFYRFSCMYASGAHFQQETLLHFEPIFFSIPNPNYA